MISPEARAFLQKYVVSAEQLDILMLLFLEPDAAWTADAVSNRVFTVPQAAAQRLSELEECGLAAEAEDAPGAYRLKLSPEAARGLEELRDAYEKNRAEVVKLVFTRRNDPLQSFADAFRLRKDTP